MFDELVFQHLKKHLSVHFARPAQLHIAARRMVGLCRWCGLDDSRTRAVAISSPENRPPIDTQWCGEKGFSPLVNFVSVYSVDTPQIRTFFAGKRPASQFRFSLTTFYRVIDAAFGCSMEASINYGFLKIIEDETIGFTGGLLMVNQDGKPTEFHCTAPLLENKTQKILYGKTWRSHVYCDLLAKALIEKAALSPELIFIDQTELRPLAGEVAAPILYVTESNAGPSLVGEEVAQTEAQFPEFELDHLNVTALLTDLVQIEFVKEACERFTSTLTLDEPFERISQALAEARQVARRSDAA